MVSALDKYRQVLDKKKPKAKAAPEPEKTEVDLVVEEVDATAEVLEITKREKAEDARRERATDSEFWFAVVFQDRASKEAFLEAVAPRMGDKYIDGHALAKAMGVEIPEPSPMPKLKSGAGRWAKYVKR